MSAPSHPAHEATAARSAVNRVPVATYRVQLRSDFGLDAVRRLLPYLQSLGISDVYLSPLFRARTESSHGYDVVDHATIDPAFGTLDDFARLAEAARASGRGILLDVVPNHMGINDPANVWWLDVLERGEASDYATFFDIDWRPAAAHLRHKVLLPFLGAPFGEVLESGQLRVVAADGGLDLEYGPKRFPLAPATWPQGLAELLSPDGAGAAPNSASLEQALAELNGRPGEPRSFDRLEALLDGQSYRLAYWRVAADEINYRRFFDINDLAAIRVEDPRVFEAVHGLVARFLHEGWITGLRIDHPDGLFDPETYFQNLQALARRNVTGDAAQPIYIVAEKILSGEETLPTDWAISGTTGYDFIAIVNRVMVSAPGLALIRENYERLTDNDLSAAQTAYESKREVLRNSLASELNMLADQLTEITQQHRSSRDFTRPSLQRGLREVIACLPVYRTYVRPRGWEVGEADVRHINHAVRWAKRRNPGVSHAVFDFIGAVLRLENPPTLTPEQAGQRRHFALKFQQVTGPAMAKGLEDTSFYRYYPLASLNEVGGELEARPIELEEFHRLMAHRAAEWPHSMSASGTHDTKRGEDFRARLNVLTEVAADWVGAVERWHVLVRPLLGEVEGDLAPDRNDLYLLYQTILGIWPGEPLAESARDALAERLVAYMQKALREAKRHTSWVSPNAAYEDAVTSLIHA
ncbi:MAG TPA: malto-oligosyltrehalose synthase, partial [Lacipirellulaceae bacterium]|nr:malto-oligosyltrehalose synthase [Lacipirellulaceae bacterium]